jgi:hypothetical protein
MYGGGPSVLLLPAPRNLESGAGGAGGQPGEGTARTGRRYIVGGKTQACPDAVAAVQSSQAAQAGTAGEAGPVAV